MLSTVEDARENNTISSDSSGNYISEYFNYTLRLRPLTSLQLNIAFDEYYEKIADFVSEKWQSVLGKSKNILVSNETKKRVIKDFILWKNDLSFREIVKGLNIFIANFRTRRNSLTYYEQLIRILIISCIEYNFSDIFIELVKDRDSFIRTRILQLVKNKSEYAILKLIDDIEKNANGNDTNWIIESYNIDSGIKSDSKTEIKIENKIEDNTVNSANVKKTATRIETITEVIDWAIFFVKNDNYDEYRKALILTMEKLQTLNDSSNLIIEKDEKEKISELFFLINSHSKKYHNLKRFRNFLETLIITTIKNLDTVKGVENNPLEFSKNPSLSTSSIDSGIYTVPTSPVEFTNSETEEQQQNKFIFSTRSKTDTNTKL